jgi:lipopolysaccharide biosynthesis glycosyltransferase
MPDRRIALVLAADDRFSRQLAATVRSVVARLSPGRELDLYLCDMGIAPRNRALIEQVAEHGSVRVDWITSLREQVEHLPRSLSHITRATYARLFIPAMLPESVDKALYLDCDLIVRRCVGDLFDVPVGEFAALGVADAASPFVSSVYGLPHWADHGRRADEVNYNCGVLLMNLAAWREGDLAGAALRYLTAARHLSMGDQQAINAVLPGRIGDLDPRWNQQTEHFVMKFQVTLPYPDEQLARLLDDPWIVHYTTNVKPWSYESTHPFRDEWFSALDGTPYRGWRPSRGRYLAVTGNQLARGAAGRLLASRAR